MGDDAATRHIVLVGAMGSGKTTIGRRLAASFGRKFLDNDELLEQRTGTTAAALVARDGIDALHQLEATTVLDALRTEPAAVIAAAASTIEDPEVRSALRERAWVGWLRADPATLAARMPETGTRPFAGADPARLVAEQAQRRDAWFAAVADAEFRTGGADADQVVALVREAVAGAGRDT